MLPTGCYPQVATQRRAVIASLIITIHDYFLKPNFYAEIKTQIYCKAQTRCLRRAHVRSLSLCYLSTLTCGNARNLCKSRGSEAQGSFHGQAWVKRGKVVLEGHICTSAHTGELCALVRIIVSLGLWTARTSVTLPRYHYGNKKGDLLL